MRPLLIGALVTSGVLLVNAQTARPSARTTSAETGLVGIKLYDTGTRVINVYGSPDQILALGSASAGGGGGGGATGGGARGGGDTNGDGTGRTAASGDFSQARENDGRVPGLIGDPFNTGSSEFRQLRPGGADSGPSGPQGGEQAGRGGGSTLDGGGAGGGGAAGGGGERTIYTRWVYKRQNAHYSFVFDKFNRAVQIEALGLKDSKVRTRKGITFDMHFSDLIRKYGAPDAYEISGDNIVVRFLVKDRVAFRLSRTRPNTPHHVTGIVVAAGKS